MVKYTQQWHEWLLYSGACLFLIVSIGCTAKKEQNALKRQLARAIEEASFVSAGPDKVISTEYLRVRHPPYLGRGQHVKWFLGEYSYRSDASISVPSREGYITGTDLGSSVHFRGRDFFYLGDTFWPGRAECATRPFRSDTMLAAGCAPNACCNDAIVVSDDPDPSDGLDVGIPLVLSKSRATVYKPLVIQGIHDDPNFLGGFWRRNLDPNYTAPGGVGLVQRLMHHPGPRVLLWYSTAIWPQGRISRKKYPHRAPRSYIAVSENGFDFESLLRTPEGKPIPFSMDREGAPARFLCTSAVEITAEQLRAACERDLGERPTGVVPDRSGGNLPVGLSNRFSKGQVSGQSRLLCQLPAEYRSHGGILVFGSGRNYRLSPLYLAYLSHAHLAREDGFHTLFASRDSAGGWVWSGEESEAYPIIGGEYVDHPRYQEACAEKTDFWACAAVVRDLSLQERVGQPTDLFGELSVKLIFDGPQGMEPTLVMLSNHQRVPAPVEQIVNRRSDDELKSHFRNVDVYARTASLFSPESWSYPPMATGAQGYGPYIIDRHTHFDEAKGELVLWHVLSLWRGPPMSDFKRRSQYGVATNQVRIPWPAGGAR